MYKETEVKMESRGKEKEERESVPEPDVTVKRERGEMKKELARMSGEKEAVERELERTEREAEDCWSLMKVMDVETGKTVSDRTRDGDEPRRKVEETGTAKETEREQEAIGERESTERRKEEVEREGRQNRRKSEATEKVKGEIEGARERMREEKEVIERAHAMLTEEEEEWGRLIDQVETEIERLEAEWVKEREEWKRKVEQLEGNKNGQERGKDRKGMEKRRVLARKSMELVDRMVEVERDGKRMREEENEMEGGKERPCEEVAEGTEAVMPRETTVKKETREKERLAISEEIEGILFEMEEIEADMIRYLQAEVGEEECVREMKKMEGEEAQAEERRREIYREMERFISRMKGNASSKERTRNGGDDWGEEGINGWNTDGEFGEDKGLQDETDV